MKKKHGMQLIDEKETFRQVRGKKKLEMENDDKKLYFIYLMKKKMTLR